jgi:hypothetical protein
LAFPGASRTSFKRIEKTTAHPVVRRGGDTHAPESASRDAFQSSLPGLHQAPLMGFPKNAPPSVSALVVHSCFDPRYHPGVSALAHPCQGVSLVPSPWFSTTLAVCSVESLAGLLRPAADHGVRRVGVWASATEVTRTLSFPRRRTLRSLSTPAASPPLLFRTTALLDSCPPVVHHLEVVRLQGFLPRVGFAGAFGVSTSVPAQLPWVSPSNPSGWPRSGSLPTRRSFDSRRGVEARRAERVRLLLSRAASRRWELHWAPSRAHPLKGRSCRASNQDRPGGIRRR